MGGVVTARVLESREDIVQSVQSWQGLDGVTSPVGGSAWVRAWLAVYGADHSSVVVVGGPVESPGAVLPLVRYRRQPWFLQTLGVRELAEATDVMGSDPAALQDVADCLARLGLPLRLRRLPADSALIPALRNAFPRSATMVSRQGVGTPTLPLDDSYRVAESHLSKRRRQDIRAARRRTAAFGHAEFSVESPFTREESDSLFDEFVAVEAAGWKTRAGTALASQPRMSAFYRQFCRLAAEEKILRFGVLRVEGRAVAGQLATEHDGRFSLFKIGFDDRLARCSPGTQLMAHTVGWAAERGLASYEFLGAEEQWTTVWTTKVHRCVEFHVYPLRPRSGVAAGAVALELGGHSFRGRLSGSGATKEASRRAK